MLNKIDPLKYVPMNKKIIICLAAGADAVLGTVVHAAYMKYYTDFIGLDPKLYGLMYMIFGIWNGINDPLFGIYSDRKKYVDGKGKTVYLMKRSAPLMVLSMVAMLYAQPSWSQWGIFTFLLITMFIYDTANTIFSINYKSYLLCLATSPEERTTYSIIQKYVNMLPAFVAGLIPVWFLTGDYSLNVIRSVFIFAALIGATLFTISLIYLKDVPDFYQKSEGFEKHNLMDDLKVILTTKSFLLYVLFTFLITGVQRTYYTLYVYYMDNVLNVSEILALLPDILGAVVQIAFYPFLSLLVKKLGARDVTKHLSWFSIAGFIGLVFVKQYWMVLICYSLIMIGFSAFWAVVEPMFGSVIDENEIKTGVRKSGIFMGFMAVFTIPAQSFLIFLFTLIISFFHYDGTAKIQTAKAVFGIRLGVGLLPAIFLLLSLIPLFLYPIDKKKEQEIKEKIEKLHN